MSAVTDYNVEQTLRASTEAERSILGGILLNAEAYEEASACGLIASDMSLDSHRRIYSRMVDLAESSRPIDLITLIEELRQHKELTQLETQPTSPAWWMEFLTVPASSTTSGSCARRRLSEK
jgi:replicative DNA helicase